MKKKACMHYFDCGHLVPLDAPMGLCPECYEEYKYGRHEEAEFEERMVENEYPAAGVRTRARMIKTKQKLERERREVEDEVRKNRNRQMLRDKG